MKSVFTVAVLLLFLFIVISNSRFMYMQMREQIVKQSLDITETKQHLELLGHAIKDLEYETDVLAQTVGEKN